MSDDVITDGWKTIYPQGPVEKLYPEACGKPNRYIRGDDFGFQKHGKTIRKRLKLIDNVIN